MKTFFGWLLAALVLFLLFATALPFFEVRTWWIRAVGFPRLQIALLALATGLGLFAIFRRSRAAHVAGYAMIACVIMQAIALYPYSPLAREQSLAATRHSPHRSLSLLVANVRMRNRNIEAFARAVRATSPDVIVVIEADDWWASQLRFLETLYPHSIREPRNNTFGMLLLSRRPLHDVAVRFLKRDSIPSIRATLELPSRERVDVFAVHPEPPVGHDPELLAIAREVDARKHPAVVIGDFNDVAWSRTTKEFQSISGTKDPRVGRGMYNTSHADHFMLRYSLDHVFHTGELRLIDLRRLENIGSDHFPLYVALSFEPDDTTSRALP